MVDSAKGEMATRGARSVRYTSGFLGRRLHVYVAREQAEWGRGHRQLSDIRGAADTGGERSSSQHRRSVCGGR